MYNNRYFRQILMKLESPRYIFENSSSINFRDNQPIASRVVLCVRMNGLRTGGRTHMANLIVASLILLTI